MKWTAKSTSRSRATCTTHVNRLLARIESHKPVLVLAANPPGPKRTCVRAHLLEGAGEGFDVVVVEVPREVSFDSVVMVAAGAL